MSETEAIFIFWSFFIIIIITLMFIRRKFAHPVKVQDADIPGQITNIVNKVVVDAVGYKVVPVMSKQTTFKMILDSFGGKILKKLIGISFSSYAPPKEYILIFGNMEMFFVPVNGNMRTKEIIANFTKVTHISVENLRKIKSNNSCSTVTFVYNNKKKFFFGTDKRFIFFGTNTKTERGEFAEFLHDFERKVNGQQLVNKSV